MPALTVIGPAESVFWMARVPVLVRVALPAGSGWLVSVNAVPVVVPLTKTVFVSRKVLALLMPSEPARVRALPVKATKLAVAEIVLFNRNGAEVWRTPAVSVIVPVPSELLKTATPGVVTVTAAVGVVPVRPSPLASSVGTAVAARAFWNVIVKVPAVVPAATRALGMPPVRPMDDNAFRAFWMLVTSVAAVAL